MHYSHNYTIIVNSQICHQMKRTLPKVCNVQAFEIEVQFRQPNLLTTSFVYGGKYANEKCMIG